MTTTLTPPSVPAPQAPQGYATFADWWHDVGDVPLDRIIMNPWIGFATEQDLLTLIERDKRLCELVDGTLVEKPVGSKESWIASLLIRSLLNFVLPRNLGIVTGEAGPYRVQLRRVRLPDVAFIPFTDLPDGRLPAMPIIDVAPALAVEVISESNTTSEMKKKLKEYFEAGTRLVWLIDPRTRSVAVYETSSDEPVRVLTQNDDLDGAGVLPGFTIAVADLFVGLP